MSLIQARCPCCGQAVDSLDLEALITRNSIREKQASILRILSRRRGRPVHATALVTELYEDDPDGGPDDALNTIYVHINRLRKKLVNEPIVIESHRHEGYALVTASEGANAARL